MLGFDSIVADPDQEAELLGLRGAGVRVTAHGKPIQLPPPEAGYADELPLEARRSCVVLSASAIGNPETARRQLAEFVERTKPDELMVTSQVYDHAAAPVLRAADGGRVDPSPALAK